MLFFLFVLLNSVIDIESESEGANESNSIHLRLLKIQTADVPHAGMDGGFLDMPLLGGGDFKIRICGFNNKCCETDYLNSRDDNWEEGEVNYFVGAQLGQCQGTLLEEYPRVTLIHKGGNGGLLNYIELRDTFSSPTFYHCPVGIKLDNSDRMMVKCEKRNRLSERSTSGCNGHSSFCRLRFDEFTFAGTHNSGTGQSERLFSCYFKNQDISVQEQMDFGIRYLGIDVIYSTGLYFCNGLATGHGKMPQLGTYQCYEDMDKLLDQIKSWLQRNPTEVIVLFFGEAEYEDEAIPRLKEALHNQLGHLINTDYKVKGHWPTLGEAVESDKRIFVFIKSDLVLESDVGFVKAISVNHKKPSPPINSTKEVTVLSTSRSKSVGSDCSFVIDNANDICPLSSDLVKLSVFGQPFRGSKAGTECLWDIARKCNRQIKESVEACLKSKQNVNFVAVDYPNYPANGDFDIVGYVFELNKNKLH